MKPSPPRCACGAPAIHPCSGCGRSLCEEHARSGVDGKGQMQYLCFACDDRQHWPHAAWMSREQQDAR